MGKHWVCIIALLAGNTQDRRRPPTKVPTVEIVISSCGFRRRDPFDAFVFRASSVVRIPEINVLL